MLSTKSFSNCKIHISNNRDGGDLRAEVNGAGSLQISTAKVAPATLHPPSLDIIINIIVNIIVIIIINVVISMLQPSESLYLFSSKPLSWRPKGRFYLKLTLFPLLPSTLLSPFRPFWSEIFRPFWPFWKLGPFWSLTFSNKVPALLVPEVSLCWLELDSWLFLWNTWPSSSQSLLGNSTSTPRWFQYHDGRQYRHLLLHHLVPQVTNNILLYLQKMTLLIDPKYYDKYFDWSEVLWHVFWLIRSIMTSISTITSARSSSVSRFTNPWKRSYWFLVKILTIGD